MLQTATAAPRRPRPGAPDLPILAAQGRRSFTQLLRSDRMEFLRQLSRGGDLFRVRLLDKAVVVVVGPAQVQKVLVDGAASLEKAAFQRYLIYPLAGEGLLTSGGALWRRQRKLMAPLFTPAQIAHFADSMVACARREGDTWKDGEVVDLCGATTRVAMSIAGKTLFSAETFSETDEIGAALTVALGFASRRFASLLPLFQIAVREGLERLAGHLPGSSGALTARLAARLHGPLFFVGAEGQRMRAALAVLNRYVQRMIEARRALMAQGEHAAPAGGGDLLDRLLRAKAEDEAGMSDQQVRDELLTLFVAGHETTATALCWTLYLLCRHPDLYQRARAEVDALAQDPTYQDLPRLSFLTRAFKEALRLYPTVPFMTRDVTAPLEVDGHVLPAGTTVLLSPYATHRDPRHWPDPLRFDPERFTPAVEATRPRTAYLPFTAGPRVCIGNHFALMEAPLVLATLLRRVDLTLAQSAEVQPDPQITLRPLGSVKAQIRRR